MEFIEWVAALLGMVCVWLATRGNSLTWIFSIISSLLYGILFWKHQLYVDACLQIVFVIVSAYGSYAWNKNDDFIPLNTSRNDVYGVIVSIILSIVLYLILINNSNNTLPLLDAYCGVFSLLALYLQSKKKIIQWWIWIAVDSVYLILYYEKQLYITLVLYGIYLLLALQGYLTWKIKMESTTTIYETH